VLPAEAFVTRATMESIDEWAGILPLEGAKRTDLATSGHNPMENCLDLLGLFSEGHGFKSPLLHTPASYLRRSSESGQKIA
jgi:hypothetical protein